jgi:hypothetical protein
MSPNFALIFPFHSWKNSCAKIADRSYVEQRTREDSMPNVKTHFIAAAAVGATINLSIQTLPAPAILLSKNQL